MVVGSGLRLVQVIEGGNFILQASRRLLVADASAVPRGGTQGFAGSAATVGRFGTSSRIVERQFKQGEPTVTLSPEP